jgi:hypothetical protein
VRCYRPPEGIIGRYLECDPDHTKRFSRDGSTKIVTATAEHLLITTKPSRIDAAYGCQRPEKPEVDHGSTSQVGHRADQCEATEVETYPRTFFSYLVEETYKITV